MNRNRSNGNSLGTLCIALSLCVGVGQTQAQDWSATEILTCFEREHREPADNGTPCDAGLTVEGVVLQSSRYDPQLVSDVLDGLERQAVSHASERVRGAAAWHLGIAGTINDPSSGSIEGVLARMESVYSQSDEFQVRRILVTLAAPQVDAAGAIRFLESVAREEDGEDHVQWSVQYSAVQGLAKIGPQGRHVLRSLYDEGAVIEPSARGHLSLLAKNDFMPE